MPTIHKINLNGTVYDLGASGSGLTDEIKQALMNLVNHVGFDDDDPTGVTYINALYNALYPPKDLDSITAVYSGGTVYDTASLDSLKKDLVVTANYTDSTSETVTTYLLSGTLTEGTSTITVSYGGETTTFSVTVVESPLPSEYTAVPYVASLNTGTANAYLINTGVTPSTLKGRIDVQIGFMLTKETSEAKYFLVGNAGTGGGGSVGFGVSAGSGNTSLGAFNGVSSIIEPEEGASVLNKRYDVTATFTSTSSSITNGTNSASNTGTGRQHNQPIYLFGLKHMYTTNAYPASGRIYYAKVSESGNLILDLLPCTRNSDGKAGFYDVVNDNFITGTYLEAGE